jgi:hypothetical protein
MHYDREGIQGGVIGLNGVAVGLQRLLECKTAPGPRLNEDAVNGPLPARGAEHSIELGLTFRGSRYRRAEQAKRHPEDGSEATGRESHGDL